LKQDFILNNPQIIQALRENQNKKADALMAAADAMDFSFSPGFEQKMEKLIRAQRKLYYPLVRTSARKTVLALAAAFILMMITVFSVSALRKPFVEFIVSVYEKFSSIIFEQQASDMQPSTALESFYVPEYIPDGYALDEDNIIILSSQRILLFAGEHDTIEFQQFAHTSSTFIIDTEGISTEQVFVGGNEGIYYSNKGKQFLVWTNDLYGFSLAGRMEKEVLLAIANSLKEK